MKSVALLAACALSILTFGFADETPPAPHGAGVVTWTDTRVHDWRPQPSERRFDEIGWAKDIRTARSLAREYDRPVFLFTMDGRINIGRC